MKGRQIAVARRRLGLTQAQLASMLGVTKMSVWHYENDRVRPPLTILRLLRAFLEGYRPSDWPA